MKPESITCWSPGPMQCCLPRGQSISIKEIKSPEQREGWSRVSECLAAPAAWKQATGPRSVGRCPLGQWQDSSEGSNAKRELALGTQWFFRGPYWHMGQDWPVSVLKPIKYPVPSHWAVTTPHHPYFQMEPPQDPCSCLWPAVQVGGQTFCGFWVETWFFWSGPSFSVGHPRGSGSASLTSCSGILKATPQRVSTEARAGCLVKEKGLWYHTDPWLSRLCLLHYIDHESALDHPVLVFFVFFFFKPSGHPKSSRCTQAPKWASFHVYKEELIPHPWPHEVCQTHRKYFMYINHPWLHDPMFAR